MIEGLVGVGLSNLVVSGGIALLAYAVHRRGRYPSLAHLLWVLALVKVVTPPMLSLPLAVLPTRAGPEGGAALDAMSADAVALAGAWLVSVVPPVLVVAWLLGSIVVALSSARRIRRFERLLNATSSAAPPEVEQIAAATAYELGLRSAPWVVISAAGLAPLTWWAGGRVRIILPRALVAESGVDELRWILAHELAHVRRRDHLVRWLEWVASVVGWWNPVVWWARRNLRRDEEDACDALVLEHVQGGRRSYARALLAVAERLSRPSVGAPAVATGIDAARSLEHRFVRIVRPGHTRAAPRALAAGTVGTALLFLFTGAHAVGAPPERDVVAPAGAATEVAEAGSTPSAPSVALEDSSYGEVSGAMRATFPGVDRDVRTGTRGDDVIEGDAGAQIIRGLAGADRLSGGPGPDTIEGGPGDDVIHGGRGADSLHGGAGDDVIRGGRGNDTISGGLGDDRIVGGAGRDIIKAGPGDDVVSVWEDGTPDEVDCGSGQDRAIVDRTDSVERCEVVVVRDPA